MEDLNMNENLNENIEPTVETPSVEPEAAVAAETSVYEPRMEESQPQMQSQVPPMGQGFTNYNHTYNSNYNQGYNANYNPNYNPNYNQNYQQNPNYNPNYNQGYGQQPQMPQYSYIPNIPGKPEKPRRKKREKNGNGWKVGVALLGIVCLCGSIFGGVYWSSQLKNENGGEGVFAFPGSKQPEEALKDVEDLQTSNYESIADIAEDVGKSVVTIVTTMENNTGGFSGADYSSEALGSGVIVGEKDDELYIATNYHVISGAKAVSVLVGEEETEAINAYYKGSDSTMDLAVIYVKKSDISEEMLKNIKIATLGESDGQFL